MLDSPFPVKSRQLDAPLVDHVLGKMNQTFGGSRGRRRLSVRCRKEEVMTCLLPKQDSFRFLRLLLSELSGGCRPKSEFGRKTI
jgi:hypothetical protein